MCIRDRQLRVERRRTGGCGGGRHGGAPAAGSAGQRSVVGVRIVPGYGARRRIAGLPALDAPGGVPGLEGAGRAIGRQSPGNPQIPPEDRAREDGEAAAGFAQVVKWDRRSPFVICHPAPVRTAGAYAAWFGALREAFCCASLRRPSTTSFAICRAARRFASISTADTAVDFSGDPSGVVLAIEGFIKALPNSS